MNPVDYVLVHTDTGEPKEIRQMTDGEAKTANLFLKDARSLLRWIIVTPGMNLGE